ncbi:MAG: diacylglycerol kinase [Epsilonproteobacteria bacterium]|nr:diacylglycerol kinase [Campylobacterota bacterium]
MNNKPKYRFFKNFKYAVDGLLYALKTESSFRIELVVALIVIPTIYLLPLLFLYKLILVITFILILIVELINSAIENVVDLVTSKFHPLAKSAKDIGATAVLFATILHISCWIMVIYHNFF